MRSHHLRAVTATVVAAGVVAAGSTVLGTAPAEAAQGGQMAQAAQMAQTTGIDVGTSQARLRWHAVDTTVVRWAYVKATEGSTFRNPHFSAQYDGAYRRGLIRGAYHYGRPDGAGGASQATTFVRHGGGWSDDGRTLPGALDIEGPDRGLPCYGKSPGQLVDWIADFVTRYRSLTGRASVIYTNPSWWRRCTGGTTRFAESNPLWIAHWAAVLGPLPGGWQRHTFWQYSDNGRIDGIRTDLNRFNGSAEQLETFTHHR